MDVDTQPTAVDWEGVVASRPHAPLLQSWGWGEFQRRVGRPPVRWLFREAGRPVVALQALRHRFPLGRESLYIPHGPVFVDPGRVEDAAVWAALRQALELPRGPVFVRIEPASRLPVARYLPVRSVASVQPTVTRVLDLTPSEADLLAAMHPKTRYNVRLAERHGVTVDEGGPELLEAFTALLRVTAARERVRFFPASYFRAIFETDRLHGLARFYRARLHGETLVVILVVRSGDTATYLHGGSSRRQRQAMAPFAAQWAAIRAMKAAGVRYYDFHGVAPADAPASHPWAGFSRFKRGFGGVDVTRGGAYDWVRSPFWYSLYRLAQRARPS